jgi:hypothetical protein
MWSLTSPRLGRTSGAKNSRSWTRKDFFNSIDPKPTSINLNLLKGGLRIVSGRLLPTLCRYTVDAIARTAGDFGTDLRRGCVRGKRAVNSTANLGRRQKQPTNCSPTIYR